MSGRLQAWTAILRVESRKRLRSSITIAGVFVILGAFYYSMFPGFEEEAEEILEAFPEFVLEMFGIDEMHTIEGFIAAEMYAFFWIVLVGVYFAYIGAGLIAAAIDERQMDLTLSNPISREAVLAQKVASLWVPLVVLNVAVGGVVYLGSVVIGDPIDPVSIAMVHLLSTPYLLVCAGIGLVCSVIAPRARTARSGAIGAVVLLWLVDIVSVLDPDYEWVGDLTPSRYLDVNDILVHQEYAVGDAVLLLVVFVVLLLVATVLFVRRDI